LLYIEEILRVAAIALALCGAFSSLSALLAPRLQIREGAD
jgi:hypothetical protein